MDNTVCVYVKTDIGNPNRSNNWGLIINPVNLLYK